VWSNLLISSLHLPAGFNDSFAGFIGEIMIVVIITLVVFSALYVAWDEISFARAEKKVLKDVWRFED
jgi:hypothetical protein